MNVTLWILQILIALHTAAGAAFKYSRTPEQTMASLKPLPQGLWMAMSVVELLCVLALVVPAFSKKLGGLVPVAAGFVVVEMLVFSALHVSSGPQSYGPVAYWGTVAAVCAFVAYARIALRPI
jgi:hypothetical protein